MRATKKYALPIFGVMVLFCVPLVLLAAEFRSGDTVNLPQGERVANDLYVAGGTVTSSSSIEGDLYAGGGTVTIIGSVSQDAVIAGGTVTVTGDVGDDLRIGAGTAVVQGTVGDDVVVGGGQVTLVGSRIGGDVLAGIGILQLSAPVTGDVRVGGGEIFLNSTVGGNVVVDADRLTLGNGTVIEGNLTYTSPREAVIEEGAVVHGEVQYTPREARGVGRGTIAAIFSVVALLKFLMLLIGALFFGLFFKKYTTALITKTYNKPLLEFGRGLAALILIPTVAVLLMLSIVGIPLGVLTAVSYVALLIFVWFMAPILLGALLYRWRGQEALEVSWKTILLGCVVYGLIGIIPILGGLVQFALMLMMLGAVVRQKWEIAKEWR